MENFKQSQDFYYKEPEKTVELAHDQQTYVCERRPCYQKSSAVWIRNDSKPETCELAVLDAKTKKVRASLFLTARALYALRISLESDHPEVFEKDK